MARSQALLGNALGRQAPAWREPGGVYFITCTGVNWIPIFTRKPYLDILLDSLRFCRRHQGLKLYAWVILDNHLRLVANREKLFIVSRKGAKDAKKR